MTTRFAGAMKNLSAFVLFALLFVLAPAATAPSLCASQSQNQQKEVKVWLNTNSGVYHCPGTRWYGKTKQGKYMGECEAKKDGNRPAYGKSCGSDCK